MAAPFDRIPFGAGRSVTLWSGDALRELPRRVGAADVVVTSPPYNRGIAYATYEDARPRDDYLRWTGRLGRRVADALAPDGSFFLNVAGSPKDPWLAWDVARAVRRSLVLQNVIHWVKSIAIDRRAAGRSAGLDRDLALGHYKPLSSRRFLHGAHEYVFHFSRTGTVPIDRLAIGVPYQDRSNVGRWRRPATPLRCRGNTWFLPYSTIRRASVDRPHPATFPPELPEWCLRLHGVERIRLAVDPFVGIGASAVAAVRAGVDFVGIDVDPGYLALAARRVRAEIGGPESERRRTTVLPGPRPRGRRRPAATTDA